MNGQVLIRDADSAHQRIGYFQSTLTSWPDGRLCGGVLGVCRKGAGYAQVDASDLRVAGSIGFVMRGQSQAENSPNERNPVLKAVVHVNFGDPERRGHGLKNVENILAEVGNNVQIEIVAHGAGIGLLVQGESKHADKIQSLIDRQVKFVAGRNSLRDKSIAEDRLLPGIQITPSDAVEVLRKQQEGFSYFKP